MSQQFKTVDQLALEVQSDQGVPNLVKNSTGTLGGWFWLSPVAQTVVARAGASSGLSFKTLVAQSGVYFTTEFVPLRSTHVLFGFGVPPSSPAGIGVRVRVEFYDADLNLISSGSQSPLMEPVPNNPNLSYTSARSAKPAGAAHAKLRVDVFRNGESALNANDAVHLHGVYLGCGTDAELAGGRGTGWTDILGPTHQLSWERGELDLGVLEALVLDARIDPSQSTLLRRGRPIRVRRKAGDLEDLFVGEVQNAKVTFDTSRLAIPTPLVNRVLNPGAETNVANMIRLGGAQGPIARDTTRSHSGSASARVEVTATGSLGHSYILATAAEPGDRVRGVIYVRPDTQATFLPYATGIVAASGTTTGTNIAGQNVVCPADQWTAIVYDYTVPADRNLTRIGVRHLGDTPAVGFAYNTDDALAIYNDDPAEAFDGDTPDTDEWTYSWTGTPHASASRRTRTLDPKRARIELTAVDAGSPLSNQVRPAGVAAISELPWVLEGCGVPWNINGDSGHAALDPAVVSTNDNASAIDQVAITRDSTLAVAWIDRRGVLNVFDPAQLPAATTRPPLDEAAYSDVAIDFDTERCINHATFKYLRIDPTTGETDEVTYGPYLDRASIAEWGAHAATFTVHGGVEAEAVFKARAEDVFAANATPTVRMTEATVPFRTAAEVASWVTTDLYELVRAVNVGAGIDTPDRVVRVKHTVTTESWLMTLGFAAAGSVAQPQVVPSPGPQNTKTLGQLLEPVGKVSMWFGAKVDCPAGWLVMDGTAFDGDEFPELAALLGSELLPDFTDVMPIGAGNKALGSSGGSPTKTLAVANLPSHDHGPGDYQVNRKAAVGSSTGVAQGNASSIDNATVGGRSGNTGGGEAFDVMPPWRALYFIIRAR